MARKTKTPRGLSIFRKLYNYIGNGSLITAWAGDGISDHNMVRIMIVYNMIGFAIQVFCDTYYLTEKKDDTYKP